MSKSNLKKLSKAELIEMVQQLENERGFTEDEKYRLEEEHFQNEAYMEDHGHIDYGYGCGVYGPY